MDRQLIERVALYAPSWVRYLLTVTMIAATGDAWIVSSGDDIAIMDADGESAMPLWPLELPASIAAGDSGVAEKIGAREMVDSILRSLAENNVGVVAFPSSSDAIVTPQAVARDLVDFAENPRDIAGELAIEPHTAALERPVLLELPEMDPWAEADPDDAQFWLLATADHTNLAGVDPEGRPALALFGSVASAEGFATSSGIEAVAVGIDLDTLVSGWLVLAVSQEWQVALVGGDEANLLTPVRLALDLAQQAMVASAQEPASGNA